MTTRLDPKAHAWMTAEPTRAVMEALTANGGAARFVGGAVRNALIGAPVTEVDVATPLPPDEVTRRLQTAGLTAVPTGIEHGTITAVAFGKPVEVTTLRRDVSTDGRRAVVAFTTDWNEDAQRRDFTMNALYADANGTLFDPTGGIADLEAGRVRFIGDANARIREDYLRILRLFRFHAWYGKGALDETAVTAAAANKDGLKQLSGERIQKEMLKLLAAGDPIPVLDEMQKAGILAEVMPANADIDRVRHLIGLEAEYRIPPDAMLRLAALLPSERAPIVSLSERWRLSNADRDRLLTALPSDVEMFRTAPVKFIYRFGHQAFQDQFLLWWASQGGMPEHAAVMTMAQAWLPPVFPLDGRDVMAAGIEEGPHVGQVLSELESWWVEQDFKPDRAALLARLKDATKRAP